VAEQDRGSDDPRLAAAARHALHDEELIAAFAAGDVEDAADVERARSFVERCATCRELHGDLVQVRTAVQASGSAAQRAMSLKAPRDFRLTAEDAARLRPGRPIARLGARLGWRARLSDGIAAFGRPLGAGLATLGVVGLLIGSLTIGGSGLSLMGGGAPASTIPDMDATGSAPGASDRSSATSPGSTAKDGGLGGSQTPSRGAGPAAGLLIVVGSALALVLGIFLVIASRRTLRPISAGRGN
jgi:hypothetical protein